MKPDTAVLKKAVTFTFQNFLMMYIMNMNW